MLPVIADCLPVYSEGLQILQVFIHISSMSPLLLFCGPDGWMVVCSIHSLALALSPNAVFVCEGARVGVRVCAFLSVRSSCASALKAERQAP